MGAFAGKYKKEDFIIAAKKAGFRQQEEPFMHPEEKTE